MRKILFMTIFVWSFVLSAQENSENSIAINDEFKAETIKLIEITSASVFNDIVAQMSTMVPAENAKAFELEVGTSLKGLLSSIADMYMQEFTHDEVKDMLAFYETPTGNKMASKTGVIMQKSMAIGQSWGAQLQQIVEKHSN